MLRTIDFRLRRLPHALLLAAALLPATACSGSSGGNDSFVVRETEHAVSSTSPIVIGGTWLVYLADEGTTGVGGTDLNGDLDVLDDVAVAVNTKKKKTTVLGVAAEAIAILNEKEIYLVVAESTDGGTDWDGDDGAGLGDDVVLLHWSDATGVVTYLATVDPGTDFQSIAVVGDRFYYTHDDVPLYPALMGSETSLHYVDKAAPTTEVQVLNADAQILRPEILGESEGLLFLGLDESEIGVNLNAGPPGADGDTSDLVMAVLDGTDATAMVESTGLAVPDEDVPVAARLTGPNDWLAAFLVSENDQGTTNLNDQALFPTGQLLPVSCDAFPDADTDDDVLFFLHYADFVTDVEAPVNCGIAGHDRVLVIDGFVATISDETDSANCDMNEDLDTNDTMARWVADVTPIAPPFDPTQLHALKNVPGGSFGLSTLDDYFVSVVDESEEPFDIDGDPLNDHDLIGFLDPTAAIPLWDFTHLGSKVSFGTGIAGEPYAGASWMAPEPMDGRLGIGFQEEVPDLDLNNNVDCSLVTKDSPEDKTDSLPVWADVENGPTLDLDGLGYAIRADNAGIVVSKGTVFFRVSEADDNTDYNGDSDKSDFILMRNPEKSCSPKAMATAHNLAEPIIVTDGVSAAAFRSSEFAAQIDFNGDSDLLDIVVRYFRF
jgi:hypothetical protein